MSKQVRRQQPQSPNRSQLVVIAGSDSKSLFEFLDDTQTQLVVMLILGFLQGFGGWLKFLDPMSLLVTSAGIGVGMLSPTLKQASKNILTSVAGFFLFIVMVTIPQVLYGLTHHTDHASSALFAIGKVMVILALVCHITWLLWVPLGYFLRRILRKYVRA